MRMNITDPSLIRALTKTIGHPPEYTLEELHQVTGPLILYNARDISWLQHCQELSHLEMVGSEIGDLLPLSKLEKLSTLKIFCSKIGDPTTIDSCKNIEHLTLNFTNTEQIVPIMNLVGLKSAVLLGNPWDEDSYFTLRPKMLGAASLLGEGATTLFSTFHDWQFTRELWGLGLYGCVSYLDRTRRILARPGLPIYTETYSDFIQSDKYIIEVLLSELRNLPSITEDVWRRIFLTALSETKRGSTVFTRELDSELIIGNMIDAGRWITESSVSIEEKQNLSVFVSRFPTCTFFRETEALLDRIAFRDDVRFPSWFYTQRQSLAWMLPNESTYVTFDEGVYAEIGAEDLFLMDSLGTDYSLRSHLQSTDSAFIPYAIGSSEGGQAYLAINLADAEDRRIYEYLAESALELRGNNFDRVARPLFHSYSDMLAHIVKVEIRVGNRSKIMLPNF